MKGNLHHFYFTKVHFRIIYLEKNLLKVLSLQDLPKNYHFYQNYGNYRYNYVVKNNYEGSFAWFFKFCLYIQELTLKKFQSRKKVTKLLFLPKLPYLPTQLLGKDKE